MRIRISEHDVSSQKVDLAVCFAYEDDKQPQGIDDADLRREVARQMKVDRFKGKPGDRLIWNSNGGRPFRRLLVLGLGARHKPPGESIRNGCARAARMAAQFASNSLAIALPVAAGPRLAQEARAAVEGALFGAYQFDRYLTDPGRRSEKLSEIVLAARGPGIKAAVHRAEVVARAVELARDLVNEPPSRLTPKSLARAASQQARTWGLQSRTLGPAELRKLGMTALLAVSRGSAEPPQVVHLTYKPRRPAAKASRIVLVGKGVTFDSGGLNLKTGDYMLTMKSDMGGAAAVLATMTTLKDLGCRHEVHALLGLTENMTGGGAYKPGDILDTYSGKTVEVGNTDAEGRLVLCDLLAYAAKKIKPHTMVDVATLTGACVVALGTQATGLFTRHDELRDALLASAASAGEKFWPLPMYEEYLALIQRGPADLNNVGGRWGGATTAALFLGEFVPRDLAWAHLDIAGPSFLETEQPDAASGGTGAGAPTLIRWLESLG